MLVHGAPGTPDADLFLQGNLKQTAIAYGSSSAYQEVTIEETEQFTCDIKDTAADTTLLSIFDPEWLDGENIPNCNLWGTLKTGQRIFR